MRKILYLFLAGIILISCKQVENENFTEIDAPAEIAMRAFRFAELYEESETEWVLGGQDPARSVIQIDCSGLVIMSYKYALVDTKYQLLKSDMTAAYMHENASTHIRENQLRKGDLIFMGESDSTNITHISLFEKAENGYIYFIDSTQKDDINGVTRRYYSEDDKRFKAFGMMRLQY